ncbi:putative TIM-barrel fold metal-dependent hydrolase [Kushneria sinocarnis]|uniref:Putative TIM-barrel fold metal-dependent hydrolase n=1 Tax=Kushneria sinocarnis TaxID=595502 RepID=A0A420WTY8_9GAMM|nr:amidohydrolase family protein [Kushneria sinocarnis]RKQ96902.1 putative TIM-barrel fold metal-dependent hydrolase [Kushneria sinocarnis]
MTSGNVTPLNRHHHAGAASTCFDAHCHIIDPRFGLVDNHGYRPEPFTIADYHRATRGLGIIGGAVVAGSFQGYDQQWLRTTLQELGPGFVGVAQLPFETTDEEIRSLAEAGVRALRFNLHRGPPTDFGQLEAMAQRCFELAGWHVELYCDVRDLAPHQTLLSRLPRGVIDHLGLSREGLGTLLALVEAGFKVKASGFGRTDLDIPATLAAVAERSPHALMFGTDLPSTRAPRAFHADDIGLIRHALGPEEARLALRDNALALYQPEQAPSTA